MSPPSTLLRVPLATLVLLASMALVPPSTATHHLAAEECEPTIFGEVCAKAWGSVSTTSAGNCGSGGGSGWDCVRFWTSWSGQADQEGVVAEVRDMHIIDSCQGSLGLTVGFCSDDDEVFRWHEDIGDVCNVITTTATGESTGGEAVVQYDAGNCP